VCQRHTRTTADGAYQLDVAPDHSYMIGVVDDTYAARTLSGVVVREDRAMSALDLTLTKGATIRGRVTTGVDRHPVVGAFVTLSERSDTLVPDDLRAPYMRFETLTFGRSTKTDSEGRYEFCVAAGRYRLMGPDPHGTMDVETNGEGDVTRDFQVDAAEPWRALGGRVVEKTPAGERAVVGAIVEVSGIGNRPRRDARTISDREGRFHLSVEAGSELVVYACNREGSLAGFTAVNGNDMNVQAGAAPASRIRGRVVDGRGRTLSGCRVVLLLNSDPDTAQGAKFSRRVRTDAEGRYEFAGVVVGASVEVLVSANDEPTSPCHLLRLTVRGPGPVQVADVVFSSGDAWRE
jgi:hypothetical protein